MATVVITELVDEAARAALADAYDTPYEPDLHSGRDALGAVLADSRALVARNQMRVDPALLDRAPALVVAGRRGVGLNNLHPDTCAAGDGVTGDSRQPALRRRIRRRRGADAFARRAPLECTDAGRRQAPSGVYRPRKSIYTPQPPAEEIC